MGSEQVHASLERFSLPCCVYLLLMLETFNSSGCLKQEASRQGTNCSRQNSCAKTLQLPEFLQCSGSSHRSSCEGPGAPGKTRVMKAKGYRSTSPRREGYLTSQAVGVWRRIRGTHRSTFSGVGAAGEPGEIRRSEPSDDAVLSALLSESALTHAVVKDIWNETERPRCEREMLVAIASRNLSVAQQNQQDLS
ncbi:hypothetical protein SRHO_G00046250 [Serrasalmus rhombeus]